MGNRSRYVLVMLALVVAAKLLLGCAHVVVEPDGTTKVRSFGASTVTVLDDGTVETSSPGLSEGLSGVVRYALQAVATFFRVAPTEPPTVVVQSSTCSE